MALQIKISGGTPVSGKSLCTTCKQAVRIVGQNCEEVILCHLFARSGTKGPVPFRVASCGEYHPSNMPWKYEMEEMAWIITAKKRGPTGFNQPQDDEIMEVVINKPKRDGYPQDTQAPK